MNNISNGTHKILFSNGKLYLDGVQIAGEGIFPKKDVTFEFKVNSTEKVERIEKPGIHSDILEINVFDEMPMKDVGPGQK
jgi:hypothetical protein